MQTDSSHLHGQISSTFCRIATQRSLRVLPQDTSLPCLCVVHASHRIRMASSFRFHGGSTVMDTSIHDHTLHRRSCSGHCLNGMSFMPVGEKRSTACWICSRPLEIRRCKDSLGCHCIGACASALFPHSSAGEPFIQGRDITAETLIRGHSQQ